MGRPGPSVPVRPLLSLNVALFGGLAAGLMWAARRVRGEAGFADASFPILLLALGQGQTFLAAETLVYVLCTTFLGVFLVVQMAWGARPQPAPALVAGLCLASIHLTFGGGVTYVPFLGTWMTYAGYRLIGSSDPVNRRAGLICLLSALAGFLLRAAYMTGYHRSLFGENETVMTARLGPVQVLKASLKYLASHRAPRSAARPGRSRASSSPPCCWPAPPAWRPRSWGAGAAVATRRSASPSTCSATS